MKLKKVEKDTKKETKKTTYRKVRYNNKDSVQVIKFKGVYRDIEVSIIYSDDHDGWLFYIDKFIYNSMRSGVLFSSKEEAIAKAEEYIDKKLKKKK